MLTKQQIAAQLTHMAKVQISDITRAVKGSEKAVALNEITDLARRLNLLADAIATKPPAAAVVNPSVEVTLGPG
ncbi:hypothetical protein [Methylobacterium iners]|uniref:XRE family transcriptional regulator n=1 Tax=Methylobacterium iners TaxID=418707 RepID=A0ABQ4S1D5_9HYPH|nr:hypothetical protein [Methylobacterium iners]GJD96920.1 hypothetical protein OCOJLMKI_4147 [Methylobacterium iners]